MQECPLYNPPHDREGLINLDEDMVITDSAVVTSLYNCTEESYERTSRDERI